MAGHARRPSDKLRENDRAHSPADFGTLEIQLTVDDPKAYTQPWTVPLEARSRGGHRDDRRSLSGEREELPTYADAQVGPFRELGA